MKMLRLRHMNESGVGGLRCHESVQGPSLINDQSRTRIAGFLDHETQKPYDVPRAMQEGFRLYERTYIPVAIPEKFRDNQCTNGWSCRRPV